jgi:predicted naringenin-chalcone synthase
LSKIVSIGTAVPDYKHKQKDILDFMLRVYAVDEDTRRKMKFLYRQSGIDTRYSVIPDYSLPASGWHFYSPTENLEPFPSLELRMQWFKKHASTLSLRAVRQCLKNYSCSAITHLITVSCTGMSAPGLDLELVELLGLSRNIHRTSVNFMGCYAAIHAMKMADAFCKAEKEATVLVVCTELCTLHFQKEATLNNITSSMLFGDGSAAMLIQNSESKGLNIESFYSLVNSKGKQDMVWELSSGGFLMTLSGYVPELIEQDFNFLVMEALSSSHLRQDDIMYWCIHPGGKKILEAVQRSLGFTNGTLDFCNDILKTYGNMSSPTILFVLKKIMRSLNHQNKNRVFGAAFGPGITMETFILSE